MFNLVPSLMSFKSVRDSILSNFLCVISDETFLKIAYKIKIGKTLNINNPLTYTEKLQWSKINIRKSLYTQCADKYAVREYVKKTIGSDFLIPILGVYDSFSDIDFDAFPKSFVMKGTHGSGMNKLVFNKDEVSLDDIESSFNKWLKINHFYHSREWQYKNIKPRIIVEEMLNDESGNVPSDIKIHCFKQSDGNFKQIIQIDTARFHKHRQNYFDSDWNPLDIKFVNNNFNVDATTDEIPEPSNLKKLLELSKQLAEPFPYVRVDLFTVANRVYFGELTFHHQSGLTKLNSHWDETLGSYIDFSLI